MRREDFMDEACKAIGLLDKQAKDGPGVLPDYAVDAITHAAATWTSMGEVLPATKLLEMMVAVLKQIYRAGYNDGVNNTLAQFKHGRG